MSFIYHYSRPISHKRIKKKSNYKGKTPKISSNIISILIIKLKYIKILLCYKSVLSSRDKMFGKFFSYENFI